MKREKATHKEKKQIERWLKSTYEDQDYNCPFRRVGHHFLCSSVYYNPKSVYCIKFFPTLDSSSCPCLQFNSKYVRRVAKELINA